MIGVIDCSVQAANPNMPLHPWRAYINSPSSLRLRNVPKRIGDWHITAVKIVAAYPSGEIKTADCVLTGGVWVGTIAGTATSGTSQNGYTVFADGRDENNNPITGYVLGKGDITILEADGTLSPDAPSYYVHLFDEQPATPHEGDLYPTESGYVIFQGGEGVPLGITQSQMQSYVTQAISGKLDKSAYHGDYIIDADGNKISANLDIAKEEPLDAGWQLSRYDETYVLTPRHTEEWTETYKIWGNVGGMFSYELTWTGVNWRYVIYDEQGGWYDEGTTAGEADATTVEFSESNMVFSRPLKMTGRLATVSQVESAISGKADLSALELKQDKLSEAQLSAIDHAVQNNGGVAKIESIALSAYEELVTPDPTTLYVIPEESGNA